MYFAIYYFRLMNILKHGATEESMPSLRVGAAGVQTPNKNSTRRVFLRF
jgi:hypothetical protein